MYRIIKVMLLVAWWVGIAGAEGKEPSAAALCAQARALLNPPPGKQRDRNGAIECLRQAVAQGSAEASGMLGRLLLDFCYYTYDREEGLALLRAADSADYKKNSRLIETQLTPPEPFRKSTTDVYFDVSFSRYDEETELATISPRRGSLSGGYGDELSMLYDYAELRSMPQEELKEHADGGNACAGILWAQRELQELTEHYRLSAYPEPQDAKREEAAVTLMQTSADRGYEMAALALAAHYGKTLTNAQNAAEAKDMMEKQLKLLTQAAEQQMCEGVAALINLAIRRRIMFGGELWPLSPEIAQRGIAYLEQRAHAKEDTSTLAAGVMYLWGLYVEPNEEKGVQLLEITALSGEPAACQMLIAYYNGETPLGGKARAAKDLQRAQFYLDLLHRYGPMWESM